MSHENKDYAAILRQRGYRVTPQRLVVLDAVCDMGKHATFSEVFQRARELEPCINQVTVYRALDVLCEVGLVVSADIDHHGKVYETSGSKRHHHLVCRQCGQEYTPTEAHFQTLVREILDEFGFQIESGHLVMTGSRRTCRTGSSSREVP